MAKISEAFLATEAVAAQLETSTALIVQTITDLRNASADRELTTTEAAIQARLVAASAGVASIVTPPAPVVVVDNS